MCWREEVLFERQETKGPESNSVLLDSQKKSPEVLQHSSICEVLRQGSKNYFGCCGRVRISWCRPDILVPLQMLRVAVSTPSQGALKWIQHQRQYSVGGQAQANPTCRGLFFKYAKTESNEFWCNGVEFKHILSTRTHHTTIAQQK